jgi:restriction system protein
MTNPSQPNDSPGFIPPHGGYRELKSFQMSELVYDATVKFCERFIDPKSRTHDQMVQAARSGNKNIAEGSQVSGTSKKMELKLVGVARASLEELLGDYQDFLRQRGLAEWGKNHPMSGVVRRLAYAPNRSYKTYSTYIENAPPEVATNTMLCLVHQTNYLLDQQLRQLEQAFLEQGGFTERLYKARQQARSVPRRPNFSRPNRKPSGPPPNPSYTTNAPPPNKGAATPRPPTQP